MLTLAITLTMVGLVLLALAIRGRITARGIFCRRCRFDLAGLTTPQTCPECGRSLALPRATRPSIRRAHRPTLVIAAIAFATAIGIAALSVPRGPAFFANLPDGQILLLNRIGVDGALTELAARSNRTPPMSNAHWRTAIARGLAHQDDTATPWDPRWGKVLGEAFVQGRMTNEQIPSYLEHAYETTITISDRISPDASWIGYRVFWHPGRITVAGSFSIPTDLKYSKSVIRTGLVGDETPMRDGSGTRGDFRIPAHLPRESTSIGGGIVIPTSTDRDHPLRAYAETRFTLRNAEGDVVLQFEPERVEQSVRTVTSDEQIVRAVTNTSSANAIRSAATVSPLTITIPVRDQIANHSVEAGRVHMSLGACPRAVAGRLYAVLDTGEIEIAGMSIAAKNGLQGHSFGIHVSQRDFEERLALLNALAERPTVDLVFRTDPTVANDNPLIDEVVEITMLFPDVPVVLVQDPTDMHSYSLDRTKDTPADPSGDTQQRPIPAP